MTMTQISHRFKSLIGFLKTEKGIACVLVFVAVIFNAFFLWPEASINTFSLNDDVLHLTAAQAASDALGNGQNPTDFWFSQIGLGFPIFHYYQSLPHLVLTGINQITSSFVSLPMLLDISRYLLLVLFPLSIFWAMRRFGFDWLAAGISALAASLISTNGLYGFDYNSYVWRGSGLYTQLCAMFFLPLALAEIWRTIRKQGSWFWPVILTAIVFLSNLMYAYILVLSAGIFVILKFDWAEIFSRVKRLAMIFILTAAVTAYFFIPFVIDGAFLNRSIWEEAYKYNSFGADAVLNNLFTGSLLDFGRLPVLSLLLLLGAVLAAKLWKKENYRLILVLAAFWILLYFGRPTWGGLLDILPFSKDLHLHRFIGGFHLAAIMLIGAGVSLAFRQIKKYSSKMIIAAGIIFLALLSPALIERANYYNQNTQWKAQSATEIADKKNEIADIKNTLKNLPAGRVYAGLAADFGKYPYYEIGSVPFYAILPQLGIDSFGYAYYAFPLTTDVRLGFDNSKAEQYDLFNIRYVLLHKTWTPAGYYTKIKEFKNYALYQVSTTGYFDLVDAPAVFYGSAKDFYDPNYNWLASPLVESKQNPIIELGDEPEDTFGLPVYPFAGVDEKVLADLSAATTTSCGAIAAEKVDFDEYQAQFTTDRDCYLMLKTNYHPGMAAVLDNQKVSTVMLTPGYIGIKVAPGTHEAIFTYHPPFYRLPLMILGALVLLALGVRELKISRGK